jgi:hypothetical protein
VSRRLVISLGNLREAWVEAVDDDDLLDALAAALAAAAPPATASGHQIARSAMG